MSSNVMTKNNTSTKVRFMAQIAMLTTIAEILMLFEIPLPFAPSFYEIDFSEVPILIGCFIMGPAAGVMMEFLKILLNFLINGTMTAGVGELANFLIGVCAGGAGWYALPHEKDQKTGDYRYGGGNTLHGSGGRSAQRLRSAPCLCRSVRRNGRHHRHGDSSQRKHQWT